jgi:predicted PurR-regulated permease PerM
MIFAFEESAFSPVNLIIQVLLVVAVVWIVVFLVMTFFFRRRSTDRQLPTHVQPPVRPEVNKSSSSDWRNQLLIPTLVSIISGVVVAIVLALLGIKQ